MAKIGRPGPLKVERRRVWKQRKAGNSFGYISRGAGVPSGIRILHPHTPWRYLLPGPASSTYITGIARARGDFARDRCWSLCPQHRGTIGQASIDDQS